MRFPLLHNNFVTAPQSRIEDRGSQYPSSILDPRSYLDLSGFDRVYLRQVSGDAAPFLAFVGARPDLAAGRAEIDSDGVALVGGHRLSKDGDPRMFWGQSFVQPLPGLSGVAGDVCGGLASGGSARPDLRPVHRKDPDGVGIARVQDHREADVAD